MMGNDPMPHDNSILIAAYVMVKLILHTYTHFYCTIFQYLGHCGPHALELTDSKSSTRVNLNGQPKGNVEEAVRKKVLSVT